MALATPPSPDTTATREIDDALSVLVEKADDWMRLPIPRKVAYLHEIQTLVAENAEAWVEASAHGKQLPSGSPLIGEEWLSGPYATLTWIHVCAETLAAVAEGKDPLADIETRTRPGGQVVAKVYPTDVYEALLLSGFRVDVWMQPSVTESTLRDTVAVLHKDPPESGGVSVVLGAGNINSIPALDLLYKLFVELEVVALKLNPVNEYLRPVFETCFAPLIRDGYLRFVSGGAEAGAYLTTHDLVDSVHMTGSARTHDAIVFGTGEEGARRKAENDPKLTKTITSELGGVSPTIVVPGPWTEADLAYRARRHAEAP